MDGDTLVGVVDEEDIMRVVVAEEDVSMTATPPHRAAPKPRRRPSSPAPRRRVEERTGLSRWIPALGVIGVWIVVWYFTKGTEHPRPARSRRAPTCTTALTDFRNDLLAEPRHQPGHAVHQRDRRRSCAASSTGCSGWSSLPNLPRPVPEIGWLGVVAIATWVGSRSPSWRIALLVAASFLSFGVFGYWQDSIDLLIVTGIVGRASPCSSGCRWPS